MTPRGLAWRSLVRQPARTALGIAGIVATGALLFDMMLLSRGLLISFDELLSGVGFDVRVLSTESLPGQAPPLADARKVVAAVGALPEVDGVVPVRFRGRVTLGDQPGGVGLFAVGETPRPPFTLLEGEGLEAGEGARVAGGDLPPLVINRVVAEALGLTPGDPVRVRAAPRALTSLPPRDFRVVGIARFPFDPSGAATAATTLAAYGEVVGDADDDTADMLLVSSSPASGPEAAVAAIRRAVPRVYAFTNRQFLDRFARTDFSYFRQISFVLSAMTLFFSFLLVTTLLTVSVNQRFAEIATLRALGFRRGRVAADLFWESGLLVATGTLLSIPVGAILARWLDGILTDIPGLPASLHFFAFHPGALGRHLALMSAAGLLSSAYPAWVAARLPIAATLRREVVS